MASAMEASAAGASTMKTPAPESTATAVKPTTTSASMTTVLCKGRDRGANDQERRNA
jgi:hypothetical protein